MVPTTTQTCCHCGTSLRPDATDCWFCRKVIASDAEFEYVRPGDESDCPSCDGLVWVSSRRCPHCGEVLDTPDRRGWLGYGGGLIAGAATSLVCLVLAAFLTFMVVNSGPKASPKDMIPGSLIQAFGLGMAVAVILIGRFDLKGIFVGRLNPDARSGTLIGMWAAGVLIVLHWVVIGYSLVHLL